MYSKRDRDLQGNMSFIKRHWLHAASLGVLACVSLSLFLAWRANRPVERRTIYVVPEPNPERAEILKRLSKPARQLYGTKASDEARVQDNRAETSESSDSESSDDDAELSDSEIEAFILELEEYAAEEKREFPPVPEGFPSNLTPVWLSIPGYQKGDMPEHESIYRVLIKLWNQGDHGFIKGAFRDNDSKVYPLYPDVVYVKWGYAVTYDDGGNPTPYKYIATTMGTHPRDFNFSTEDFVTGDWETMYPDTKFVSYDDAGYDPYTFLTDDD